MAHIQSDGSRVPRGVGLALIGVVLQAVVNVLGGVVLLGTAGDAGDGQGAVQLFGVLSIGIGLLLGLCAALTRLRLGWVRVTVIVLQVLAVIDAAVSVFTGGGIALLGFVLPVLIMCGYGSRAARDWFAG